MNAVLRHVRRLAAVSNNRDVSDRELLARFVDARDEAAFATLVERHGPLALAAARRVGLSEQDAEDVLQAAFLVLVRRAGDIRGRDSVGNWLYGVVHNLARKARVQANLRRQREHEAAERLALRLASLPLEDVASILDEELQRLPEKYRAPILLCCLDGKSRDEAASELGWPCGTVKIRLERGREQLRQRLARRGLTLPAVLGGVLVMQVAARANLPARVAAGITEAGMRLATGSPLSSVTSETVRELVLAGLPGRGLVRLKLLLLLALCGSVLAFSLPGDRPSAVVEVAQSVRVIEPPQPIEPAPRALEMPAVGRQFTAVFRATQPGAATVILRAQEKDTSYALAPDLRIQVDGKPGTLASVKRGTRVGVTLTADNRAIAEISAVGPLVVCPIRSVDPERRTLVVHWTASDRPTLREWNVPADAVIEIHGRPSQLADLLPGQEAALRLSAAGNTIVAIQVAEPR